MEMSNIVSSVTYSGKLDLLHILKTHGHIARRLKGFPAIVLKFDTSDLCHVFSNGKIIVLGATSIKQAHDLFDRYVKLLQDIGYTEEYKDFKIVNIVARYVHPRAVCLVNLAQLYKLEFEPELFPAVRLRLEDLKITINIFRSGKCMILGARGLLNLQKAVAKLQHVLENAESHR